MGTAASCSGNRNKRTTRTSPLQLPPSPSHTPLELSQKEKDECKSPLLLLLSSQSKQSLQSPPYAEEVRINTMDGVWRERMLEAADGDPIGVTRDFPRIPVYVATHTHHNYCNNNNINSNNNNNINSEDMVAVKEGKRRENEHEDEVELLAMRNQRVQTAVGLLMELCGEDATRMHNAWSTHASNVDVADASALLLAVLLESGMMRAAEQVESGNNNNNNNNNTPIVVETTTGTTTREAVNPPSYGAADTSTAVIAMRSSPKYIVQSKALRLMQYMVQSVVFCSIQWITELLRFPWCKHIQDVVWTVHVFTEKNNNNNNNHNHNNNENNNNENERTPTEFIVLQHKQTLRHYVEPRELRYKPRFEIDWTCSLFFNSQQLLCGNAEKEVADIRTEVLAARVERPERTFCWISADWRQRRRELAERLEDHFCVALEEVPTLLQRRPDGRRLK